MTATAFVLMYEGKAHSPLDPRNHARGTAAQGAAESGSGTGPDGGRDGGERAASRRPSSQGDNFKFCVDMADVEHCTVKIVPPRFTDGVQMGMLRINFKPGWTNRFLRRERHDSQKQKEKKRKSADSPEELNFVFLRGDFKFCQVPSRLRGGCNPPLFASNRAVCCACCVRSPRPWASHMHERKESCRIKGWLV